MDNELRNLETAIEIIGSFDFSGVDDFGVFVYYKTSGGFVFGSGISTITKKTITGWSLADWDKWVNHSVQWYNRNTNWWFDLVSVGMWAKSYDGKTYQVEVNNLDSGVFDRVIFSPKKRRRTASLREDWLSKEEASRIGGAADLIRICDSKTGHASLTGDLAYAVLNSSPWDEDLFHEEEG